ncbi:MAG: pseudouridine synthase [Clostridia bacterium]|nr:pseudouridine synthase [Clostridia bacterium]
MLRINKYLANSGVASRRAADKLIEEGRVSVNGKIVTELGFMVRENNDSVSVDKVRVKPVTSYTYILFNKPKGCVTTVSDEKGRKTVFDFVKTDKRLFPVGRLDYDSEGLLILTNDGDLTQMLTHPSNDIAKQYIVKIEGDIVESDLAILRKGVVVEGVKYDRAKIKKLSMENGNARLEVTIYEGKNREIRKMFDSVEKNVIFLKRIAVEDLRLGGLGRGEWRFLREEEVEYLKSLG